MLSSPQGFLLLLVLWVHPGLISPFKESPAILLADILIRFSQESQRGEGNGIAIKKSIFLSMPLNYNFAATLEKNKRHNIYLAEKD